MKRSFAPAAFAAFVSILLCTSPSPLADVRTDTSGWFPFEVDLDALPAGIDAGAIAGHRPAGKFGFLHARGEQFRFEKSEAPFRLWGVNLTNRSALPDKPGAEQLARHLARLGFNSVRFHHIDELILDKSHDDSQHLSAEAMDKLDYFIKCLKDNGIYADFNLLTSKWKYRKGDEVADYQQIDKPERVVHFFDPRLIQLQKDQARRMIQHKNPYTGLRYCDDPAVAVVEIINETSFGGSGITNDPSKLPPHYLAELTGLFNRWAKDRYHDNAALAGAWGGLAAGEDLSKSNLKIVGLGTFARQNSGKKEPPSRRVKDTQQFYTDVETGFYRDMVAFLRNDLGFKGLINGTNNWYGMSGLKAQAACDYTDIHGYVDHPLFPGRQWDRNNFRITQSAVVNWPQGYNTGEPLRWPNILPLFKWPLGAVEGVPLVSSEWNWAFPNRHQYEGPLMVAAYGSLQGMSGFYEFTYNNALDRGGQLGYFDLDPAMLVQMPAAAIAFLRGDVRAAEKTVEIPFSDEQVVDASLKNGTSFTHNAPGGEVPLSAAAVHRVRKRFTGNSSQAAAAADAPQDSGGVYRSDTGQLVWDGGNHEKGVVTMDAPRLCAAVGFLGGREVKAGPLVLRLHQPAAVSVISLDGKPVAESGDMLLTVVGREEATGQVWRDDYKALAKWGTQPMLLEPVEGEVELATPNVKVYAIGGKGDRRREVPTSAAAGGLRWPVGKEKTVWYRLERK